MHWQVWVLCICGIVSRLCFSLLLGEQRGCSSCSCCHTAVEGSTGKGQCWAQVVYRSCQNATMPLTQAFHSRVAGQLSPLSCLSILNLWQEAACHPRAFGWDAAVGSSVCFSREAELFFSCHTFTWT